MLTIVALFTLLICLILLRWTICLYIALFLYFIFTFLNSLKSGIPHNIDIYSYSNYQRFCFLYYSKWIITATFLLNTIYKNHLRKIINLQSEKNFYNFLACLAIISVCIILKSFIDAESFFVYPNHYK
jgi:hypothetical protein